MNDSVGVTDSHFKKIFGTAPLSSKEATINHRPDFKVVSFCKTNVNNYNEVACLIGEQKSGLTLDAAVTDLLKQQRIAPCFTLAIGMVVSNIDEDQANEDGRNELDLFFMSRVSVSERKNKSLPLQHRDQF
jgi:hypothetical protein